MSEVAPPNASELDDLPASPERCRQILLDILMSPRLTNGENATAEEFLFEDHRSPRVPYHAAVLAAARWAFQTGELQIVLPPGLRLVE